MHFEFSSYLIFTTAIVSTSSLSCWICTSLFDEKCTEGPISEISGSILKSNCSLIKTATGGSTELIERTIPATTCFRMVLKAKGRSPLVVRSCASPGDSGIDDPETVRCDTMTSPDGAESVTSCFCKEDFCNGPEKGNGANLKFLATPKFLLPFGLFLAGYGNIFTHSLY